MKLCNTETCGKHDKDERERKSRGGVRGGAKQQQGGGRGGSQVASQRQGRSV